MSDQDIKEIFKNSIQDSSLDNDFHIDNEIPIDSLPSMHPHAFFGLLKKFVDAAALNSEASSVAVAANVLSWLSASLNRYVYQWIGDTQIHCRPFFLLVGKSGKARKGTSESLPRRVFKEVDNIRKQKNDSHLPLNIHSGGLSSGEGICFAIRDASDDPNSKDQGVTDKRLLVIESEFANVLANCKRETSTLSAVIRNVFDGRTLAPLTKTNRTCATDPHVVVIGHITSHELVTKVSHGVEVTNGLLNRFLICVVAREQLIPLPVTTSNDVIDNLAKEIIDIFDFVDQERQKNLNGSLEIKMNPHAEQYWKEIYPRISRDHPGVIGALLARAEVYARMLAMIFAILDKKLYIEIIHIRAALYWINYVEESIWYLFGNTEEKLKQETMDDFSEKILRLLINHGPRTRTEISQSFSGHKTNEIKEALEHLLTQSPARIEQTKERTKGRSKEIYRAKEAKNAK